MEELNDKMPKAKDFVQDNLDLELLLNKCNQRNIKIISCCKENKEKEIPASIAFEFNSFNEKYIYAIMAKFNEKNIAIDYCKGKNKSYLKFADSWAIDFKKTTTLFKEINAIITSFNEEKDYYNELSLDFKNFIDIIKFAKADKRLNITEPQDFFFLLYTKFDYKDINEAKQYQYGLYTSNNIYNLLALESGLKYYKVMYFLNVFKKEDAAKYLENLLIGLRNNLENKMNNVNTLKLVL